jgi:hypothetical protein
MPIIVRATASTIAKKDCGPAPKIMGIGPIKTTAPTLEAPEKTATITMKTIPMKIRIKPKRKSLSGIDHGKVLEASFPRCL